MSQLPVIGPSGARSRQLDDRVSSPEQQSARDVYSAGAAAVNGPNALETLRALSTSGALSAEIRRKLATVLRSAERERSGVDTPKGATDLYGSPSSSAPPSSSSRLQATRTPPETDTTRSRLWVTSLVDSRAPQARQQGEEILSGSEHVRARNFDIAEPPTRGRIGGGTANCAPNSTRRSGPALQNPDAAFEELNRALTYTMRYVEEVTQIDFDITAVREYDGSQMESRERLFLSVTCSTLANFALCSTLNLDLRKLAHFLADLYKYYSDVNQYHNAIHAADALQMSSLFFRDPAVNFLFSDEEVLLCFLGVLALDVAHPGMHTVTLAEINHPLVTVYGDFTAKEQSSLLVFMHQLFIDDNFFLNFDSPNHVLIRSRSLLREALYDIAVPAAPRMRPLLVADLSHVSAARAVSVADISRLLTGILVLSRAAFAFRSQTLALTWSGWWRDEIEREEEERQRQSLRRLFPSAPTMATGQWAAGYCEAIVGGLAEMIRAVVPTDLYDNLDRNRDPAALQQMAAANASGSSSHRALAPFVTRGSDDGKASIHLSMWTDTTVDIMDILTKTAAHANSLDRKASRGAILNASPHRANTGLLRERRTSGYSGGGVQGRRGSSSVMFGASMNSAATTDDDDVVRHVDQTAAAHPNRSEHYFSFLRLYDEFERAGRTSDDFAGQLVFLALQLDPTYIASAARGRFGVDCNAAACVELAAYIRETEEAPTTAEAIAATRTPSLLLSVDEPTGTDGFVLFLMEMYLKREESAAMASGFGDECRSDDSTGTSPPAADSQQRSFLPPASPDTTPLRFAPQRDSPIRMPVSTDTRGLQSMLKAHPLVGGASKTEKGPQRGQR